MSNVLVFALPEGELARRLDVDEGRSCAVAVNQHSFQPHVAKGQFDILVVFGPRAYWLNGEHWADFEEVFRDRGSIRVAVHGTEADAAPTLERLRRLADGLEAQLEYRRFHREDANPVFSRLMSTLDAVGGEGYASSLREFVRSLETDWVLESKLCLLHLCLPLLVEPDYRIPRRRDLGTELSGEALSYWDGSFDDLLAGLSQADDKMAALSELRDLLLRPDEVRKT